MLAMAVGCSTSQNGLEADVAPASTADASTAETIPVEGTTTATETTAAPNQTNQTSGDVPVAQGQGEPGYVGYPLMGETAAGGPVYYISSQPIDCADGGCVSINFLQVDAVDPYKTMDGRAVANCARGVLSEVMLDEDLVAYQLESPDAAMTRLLDTACEAARPEVSTIPTVPAGLEPGMSYAEVRSRLMDAGWVAKDVSMDHYTPLEQKMYDRGYTEVLGCSGTGLCRFEFDYFDAGALSSDEALVVITAFADSDIYFEDEPLLSSASIDLSSAP
ncbi:MAG: hypothetical protein AAF827_22835 [Cyanobacteria bacterium P01_D01_bin.6]